MNYYLIRSFIFFPTPFLFFFYFLPQLLSKIHNFDIQPPPLQDPREASALNQRTQTCQLYVFNVFALVCAYLLFSLELCMHVEVGRVSLV